MSSNGGRGVLQPKPSPEDATAGELSQSASVNTAPPFHRVIPTHEASRGQIHLALALGPLACASPICAPALSPALPLFFLLPATAAKEACNHQMLRGKAIFIQWSERDPSKRRSGTGTVFVKNLAPTITSSGLADVFTAIIGPVKSARVVLDERGNSRCYGYVTFEDDKHVQVRAVLLSASRERREGAAAECARAAHRSLPYPTLP